MRSIAVALQPLIDLPFLQSYYTLQVAFPNGEVLRWAGSQIQIPGEAPYNAGVIRSSGLRQSLGAAVDVVSITLTNTDWSHSRRLIASSEETLAPAIVGRLHRDYRNNGAWVWRSLLAGVVGAPTTNETEATYTVISDLAAAGLVGATRLVSLPCQWRFRGQECSYSGVEQVCDFTFDQPTGCAGRGVQHRFSGFIYDVSKLSLSIPAPDSGGSGGGGGGGGVFDYDHDKIPIDYGY